MVALLEEAVIARFCCHNDDGTIHATPVWFKYENDRILIVTPDGGRKARNVKRNNKVTILIDTEKPVRGIMIYGTAEFDYNDVLPTAISISEKYLPKEQAKNLTEEFVRRGMNLLISVRPESIVSFNF